MLQYLPVETSDYQRITEIMTAAFDDDTQMHTDLRADGPPGYADGTLIKKLIANRQIDTQKIIWKNELIGLYAISYQGTTFTLELLVINPSLKNHGFGQRVWRDIEQQYPEAERWCVETPDYSQRNCYFYQSKCGFLIVGERLFPGGAKAVILQKQK